MINDLPPTISNYRTHQLMKAYHDL